MKESCSLTPVRMVKPHEPRLKCPPYNVRLDSGDHWHIYDGQGASIQELHYFLFTTAVLLVQQLGVLPLVSVLRTVSQFFTK